MTYNRSEITNIIKQEVRDVLKTTKWVEYFDAIDSDKKLTTRTLKSLGLNSIDISEIIFETERALGISFNDKDFIKPYSELTLGDIVDVAVKNYNAKKNITSANIGKTSTEVVKVFNYKTIKETVEKVFLSFGISAKEIVPNNPLKSYNFDFMDTLALMGTIDHEFNLPGEYICDNFEQKAKKTPNLVSIFTMKFHITI